MPRSITKYKFQQLLKAEVKPPVKQPSTMEEEMMKGSVAHPQAARRSPQVQLRTGCLGPGE